MLNIILNAYAKDAENQIKTKTDRIIPVDIQVHALGF